MYKHVYFYMMSSMCNHLIDIEYNHIFRSKIPALRRVRHLGMSFVLLTLLGLVLLLLF